MHQSSQVPAQQPINLILAAISRGAAALEVTHSPQSLCCCFLPVPAVAAALIQLSKRKRKGLDLCLWVDPARLLRAAINKDPTVSACDPAVE